jgi:hypothetical protein
LDGIRPIHEHPYVLSSVAEKKRLKLASFEKGLTSFSGNRRSDITDNKSALWERKLQEDPGYKSTF